MRELDRGESFIITRNGVPVGELMPVRAHQFVAASAAVAAFTGSAELAPDQFRADVDAVLDQNPAPH